MGFQARAELCKIHTTRRHQGRKKPAAVGRRRAAGPQPPWGAARRPPPPSRFGGHVSTTIFPPQPLRTSVTRRAAITNRRKPRQNQRPRTQSETLKFKEPAKFRLGKGNTPKPASFLHFNGSIAIPGPFDFAGFSPVRYGRAPSYGRPERKDSAWTILQLHRIAFEQCRKPLSLRNQPLLPSHLNASAIPCADFSSHFKNFEYKGNQ